MDCNSIDTSESPLLPIENLTAGSSELHNVPRQISRLAARARLLLTENEVCRIERALNIITAQLITRAPEVSSLLRQSCKSLEADPSTKYQCLRDLLRALKGLCEMEGSGLSNQAEGCVEAAALQTDRNHHGDNCGGGAASVGRERGTRDTTGGKDCQSEFLRLLSKVRRLRLLLSALEERIAELDSAEVSLNDMYKPDSAYIRQAKLMERAFKVTKLINKFSRQLRDLRTQHDPQHITTLSEHIKDLLHGFPLRHQRFKCRLSKYPSIDKYMCALVMQSQSSKDDPCFRSLKEMGFVDERRRGASSVYFPDYQDVHSLIRKLLTGNDEVASEAKDLFVNLETRQVDELRVAQISKSIFAKLGDTLQSFRRQNLHQSVLSWVSETFDYSNDPAAEGGTLSDKLRRKLQSNKEERDRQMAAIFQKYTEMEQMGLGQVESEDSDGEESHKRRASPFGEDQDVLDTDAERYPVDLKPRKLACLQQPISDSGSGKSHDVADSQENDNEAINPIDSKEGIANVRVEEMREWEDNIEYIVID